MKRAAAAKVGDASRFHTTATVNQDTSIPYVRFVPCKTKLRYILDKHYSIYYSQATTQQATIPRPGTTRPKGRLMHSRSRSSIPLHSRRTNVNGCFRKDEKGSRVLAAVLATILSVGGLDDLLVGLSLAVIIENIHDAGLLAAQKETTAAAFLEAADAFAVLDRAVRRRSLGARLASRLGDGFRGGWSSIGIGASWSSDGGSDWCGWSCRC